MTVAPAPAPDPTLRRLALVYAALLPVSMAASNVCLALFLLRAASLARRGAPVPAAARPVVLAFLALAGWQAASCLWSPAGVAALAQVKFTHILVFLGFAVAGPRLLPPTVATLVAVNALLLFLAPPVGMMEARIPVLHRLGNWAVRYSGCFTVNIAYGTFLAIVLLAAVGLDWRAWPPPRRGMLRGGAAVCLAALLLTMSRSAWLGFWCGMNLLLWFRDRRIPVALHAGAALALAALLMIGPLRGHPLARPFVMRIEASLAGDSSGRSVLYACGAEMIRRAPLLGHGVGAVPELLDGMRDIMRRVDPSGFQARIDFGHLHSNPLQILAETGLVGLALYLALVHCTAAPFVRRLAVDRGDHSARVALACIVAVFVVGLFEYNLTYSDVNRVYWMILGSCVAGADGEGAA